jgi:hypothetical protein
LDPFRLISKGGSKGILKEDKLTKGPTTNNPTTNNPTTSTDRTPNNTVRMSHDEPLKMLMLSANLPSKLVS